jgi:hypothetical protein
MRKLVPTRHPRTGEGSDETASVLRPGKWRRRFLKDRCDGLLDEARPGRPRTINDDQVAAVIERTLRHDTDRRDALVDPLDGGGNWAIPRSAGCRWRSACSRTVARRFKLSNDPLFVDKVGDIVGLYLSPPNRALVLSIDEKSQTARPSRPQCAAARRERREQAK